MNPVKLGADGMVEYTGLPLTNCCPPDICHVDLCALRCSFIQQLPSGPLWDRAKALALASSETNGSRPCNPVCEPDLLTCQSIVAHAVYAATRLYNMLTDSLMPSIRESNPHTAMSTLDDWLDRLGWEDCYKQSCSCVRSPYLIYGECTAVFCDVDFSDELTCAVKHAIIVSLTRLQMGIIKNVDGINWVLEPLSARIDPIFESGVGAQACVDVKLELSKTSDYLDGCPPRACDQVSEPVLAYHVNDPCTSPAGTAHVIWPALLAAECIVRSLLINTCSSSIRQAPCELPT